MTSNNEKKLLTKSDINRVFWIGKKQHPQMLPFGADDGNRTHTTSLEGWSSTTKLHLQDNCLFKSAYIL